MLRGCSAIGAGQRALAADAPRRRAAEPEMSHTLHLVRLIVDHHLLPLDVQPGAQLAAAGGLFVSLDHGEASCLVFGLHLMQPLASPRVAVASASAFAGNQRAMGSSRFFSAKPHLFFLGGRRLRARRVAPHSSSRRQAGNTALTFMTPLG